VDDGIVIVILFLPRHRKFRFGTRGEQIVQGLAQNVLLCDERRQVAHSFQVADAARAFELT
jgi:hypothetical protein